MTRDRWLLMGIAATWLISGLVEPFTPSYGEGYNEAAFPHALVVAVLLFAWCKAHAARVGCALPPAAPLLVAFLCPIGVPYYFFRALPWRRALVGVLGFAVFLVVCSLLNYGGQQLGVRIAA